MADRMWVVEWTENDMRLQTATWSWRAAIRHGFEMAQRFGCQVRIMSEDTYRGENVDG